MRPPLSPLGKIHEVRTHCLYNGTPTRRAVFLHYKGRQWRSGQRPTLAVQAPRRLKYRRLTCEHPRNGHNLLRTHGDHVNEQASMR
jgi:hypothetical protein